MVLSTFEPKAYQTHVTRKGCKDRWRVTFLLDAAVSCSRRPLKIRDFVWEVKYWDLRMLNNVKSNLIFPSIKLIKKDFPALYSTAFWCLQIYEALYGDAMLVSLWGTQNVRRKVQKHLFLSFSINTRIHRFTQLINTQVILILRQGMFQQNFKKSVTLGYGLLGTFLSHIRAFPAAC